MGVEISTNFSSCTGFTPRLLYRRLSVNLNLGTNSNPLFVVLLSSLFVSLPASDYGYAYQLPASDYGYAAAASDYGYETISKPEILFS